MKHRLLLAFLFMGALSRLSLVVKADVRMPSIFGDHMMLQQSTEVAVWGWADPGEKVVVSGNWGNEAEDTASAEGAWKVFLETPAYGGPYIVSVKGNNLLTIKDVLIGEVWLCAGQSNMGWRLSATIGGKEEVAAANFPGIRIFRSERAHSPEPLTDSKAEWKVCDPESAETCSAVTYYFAKKLHQELGVPVGVVLQPYAGTPIEGWMPRDIQLDDTRTRQIIDEMDAESAGYDLVAAQKQLERATELWKKGERRGEPTLRTPSNWGHQYPGNIFNGMIYPVRPYGIRGAIWYQGERNAKDVAQAAHYENQLPMLINYYRYSWHTLSGGNVSDDFPFYFVQLPAWLPEQTEPVEPHAAWAVNRNAMRVVANTVSNTGIAVSIDTGDAVLLHPKDKKPIGLRLAYLALEQTYDRDFVGSGPVYRSYEVDGNKILIYFDFLGSGLRTSREGPIDTFAIAGIDRKFVWAKARIQGDHVEVTADSILNPVAVRYAWADNPSRRNLLYNKEGIPASPFRTDDWPLYNPQNYVPVDQLKPATPEGYQQVEVVRPSMTQ
jgi:sialate O-acetylesterase